MGRSAPVGLLVLFLVLSAMPAPVRAWSNGGFSADPDHPDYGTHDWLAEHAMRWLPENESRYLRDNLSAYLHGTELPDDGSAPEGIGDTVLHHVYYRANGTLQDNASARRAQEEFNKARANLTASNLTGAARRAGVMSHYIVDVAVFGHLMSGLTDWGAEVHHSDYENNVTADMTGNVSAEYDNYLVFDGSLDFVTAHDAALRLAYNTTFGNGASLKNCTWMDSHYSWSDSDFENSTGASLNLSANLLADVLHTLAVVTGYAVDATPPSITITAPLNNTLLNATAVNVTGTASDDVGLLKIEVSRDGATWAPCCGTASWNGSLVLPEGRSTILARATDTSGNTNSTSVAVNVSLPDTTPPTVTITYPVNGTHLYSPNITVTGTASDNRGVQKVELGTDGIQWGPANGTFLWSWNASLASGQNRLFARATDTSGNVNTTNASVILEDTARPAIEITSPAEGAVLTSSNLTVTGSSWDDANVTLVELGTDNLTWTACNGTHSWSGNLNLPDGPHTIYARATDGSGNRNTASIHVTVNTADTTPPKIAITAPADGAVLGSPNVTVTGTAGDDRGVLKVELSTDDSTWLPAAGTASWSCALLLREGRSTILARVLDTSGNRNITAIIVNVVIPDVTSPTVAFTSPADGVVLSCKSVNVSGTARDDKGVARVDVSLDNTTWYPGTLTDRWTSALVLAEGRNTIYARAIDISGNTGLASISVIVVLPDTTSPTLTIVSPASGSSTGSASIEVRGEARDDKGVLKVEASLDGVSWKPCSGNATWCVKLGLKEGKNTIFIRASDAAGNTCNGALAVTFNKPREINWVLIILVVILLVVVLALLAHGMRRHRRRRRRRR